MIAFSLSVHPPKSNIDTKNDGSLKVYLLSNMAILGIHLGNSE